MANSKDHYSQEEILFLAEQFVNESGTVAFQDVLATMLRVRMIKMLRTDTYKKGIHEYPRSLSPQSATPANPFLQQ